MTGKLTDSRTKMILAAEALFARGGIDGVSLRQIAARAGQKNHHAVQSHFNSREGLVRRFSTTGRSRWIGTSSTCSKPPKRDGLLENPRMIADTIFVPQLEVISELGDFSYANFLCQYLLGEFAFQCRAQLIFSHSGRSLRPRP